MTMKKHIAALMAAVLFCGCVTACGSTEEKGADMSGGYTVEQGIFDEASGEDIPEETEEYTGEADGSTVSMTTTKPQDVTTSRKKRTTTTTEKTTTTTTTTTTLARRDDALVDIVTNDSGMLVAVPFQEGAPDGETVYVDGMSVAAPDADEMVTEKPLVNADDYVSDYQQRFIYWLDIEKDIDYIFNDEFVKVTFKVREGTPAGEYPIGIDPDFSTVMGVNIDRQIDSFDGSIAVGQEPRAASNVGSNISAVSLDNVSAEPGETVEVYLRFRENPGMAAFIIWLNYDANAFEWISAEACGEFAEVAAAHRIQYQN